MKGTVDVRIRNEGDTKAVKFTQWPLAKLDQVLRTIREWGIYDGEDCNDGENVFGQFVVKNGIAYFEVIVGSEE